jgi:peptidoglycan lytic transglycosylase D
MMGAALAACAGSTRPEDGLPPPTRPMPIVRAPQSAYAQRDLEHAFDLQVLPEDPPLERALTGSTAVAEMAPNEAESIDLEMEEERALEEDVLNEMEAKAGTSSTAQAALSIRSILAVTGTISASYDIPMAEDERVAQWIRYLQGPFRKWYWIWLSRSTRYVPIFREILTKHGLPQDLIFLAMIESGFSPNAYSWAHAAGPWQFVQPTGRRYGLDVGFWLDERRDFERATHAAAKYLKKLYDQFGDWYLAWAAYNAGEGRVEYAIRRAGTRDFWKLSRTWHLKRETKHYVPKLLAAAIIAKQPSRYGFGDVEYLPPFDWDVVTVTTAVDLKTLAKGCGDPSLEDELKFLNPSLRRSVTPPGRRYDVRVPKGAGLTCTHGLGAIPASERVTYRYYRLAKGETIPVIAKRFATSPDAILAFNNLDAKRIHSYEELVVPIPASKDAEIPIIKPPENVLRAALYAPEGAGMIVHRVLPGDSLWKIAQRYHTTVKNLRLWNGLWQNAKLHIGQAIRIYRGQKAQAKT